MQLKYTSNVNIAAVGDLTFFSSVALPMLLGLIANLIIQHEIICILFTILDRDTF